jgi:hypothetical protein
MSLLMLECTALGIVPNAPRNVIPTHWLSNKQWASAAEQARLEALLDIHGKN